MIRRISLRLAAGATVGLRRGRPCLPQAWGRARLATCPPRWNAEAGPDQSGAAPLPAHTDLLEVYRSLVASGRLTWDDEQVRIVMKLRHLLNELRDYSPPLDLLSKLGPAPPQRLAQAWWRPKSRRTAQAAGVGLGDSDREHALVKVLSGEEEIANLTTPKGILITGPPGSGKSFLLSLFFDALPTNAKARHHYHAFTLWLYQRVFAEMERRRLNTPLSQAEVNREMAGSNGWRAVFASGRWKEGADIDYADTDSVYADPRDTIPFVIAKEMILQYHVLYFDELQLLDASSAALLRDTLSWYWRLGGVIISCSNRVPDDLYYHGVQRERMAGFLDALKARCDVVELDGGRDWRRVAEETAQVVPVQRWYEDGNDGFDQAWRDEPGEAAPADLVVYGRRVEVPSAKGEVCRFPFPELCQTPLGPADYLSLASTFSTFYIDEVPILLLKNKNEARRLINLIDALYESKCKIVIRAAARPEHLFFPDALDPRIDPEHHDPLLAESLSETLGAQARSNVSLYNPKTRAEQERQDRADMGSSFSVMSIFTGEDERFAYKRAVSRLIEMSTSKAYAAEPWTPLGLAARGWEVNIGEITPAAGRITHLSDGLGGVMDEMAAESGVKAPEGEDVDPRFGSRSGAPRFKEVHAWGVEEGWGPKAGKWGKGASAFEKEDKK